MTPELLQKIKECVKFYSAQHNWMVSKKDHMHTAKMQIIGDPESFGCMDTGTLLIVGGKKARSLLNDPEFQKLVGGGE